MNSAHIWWRRRWWRGRKLRRGELTARRTDGYLLHRVGWYSGYMEHGRHLVDLVDENGLVVGTKQRRDIDKNRDTYHSVYTMLVSPVGQVILARIPNRKD